MKKEKIALLIVFLLAFGVRLYKLDNPVADWHSWRQADTAAVARNFIKFGFDPLRPRYDDLSNVASGKDNPQGYRMVEFPVYQIIATGFYFFIKGVPGVNIEISLRLINIFASLGIMAFLYGLVRRNYGKLVSFGTILIFGFLPYSIYFSRTILPEMLAVFFAMGAVWTMDKWGVGGKWGIWIAGILSGLAILTKPTAGFLLLSIAYFWLKNFKLNRSFLVRFVLFSILAFGGFFWWRNWINRFPEGIPANDWLLNGGNIRFSGAFFYWLLGERMSKLIFGYWLLIPFALGLILNKRNIVHLILLAGVVLYAVIFARGNIQHDYYQIIWLPPLAIYSGFGIAFLLSRNNLLNYWSSILFLFFIFLTGILFSWHDIRGYYWINNPDIVEAGKAVDRTVPVHAKVIAPYGGDTAFLYQTNRQGWPVGFEIEKKITQGANYYVNVNVKDPETQYVLKKWTPLVVNDRFVIVKLN